ncbi:MAG: DUF3892 domain-containing protein [Chloroflexi bacterium]|nr:DUF3892 domain-containing protein [Chloroflexota bacterium]MDA1175011.1 DUF3892 domain-containing protein [Chloroflexota bacterium]
MANRLVTQSAKDSDDDIIALCNASASWSPRPTAGAITDIELGLHTYFTQGPGGTKTLLRVVNGTSAKYLRTDSDSTERNNLNDLPDC